MYYELVQYYLRTKYYYSAESVGAKAIQINSNIQSIHQLYYGLSLVLQNKLSKGLTILDALVKDTDIGLASALVMIHAHRLFEVIQIFKVVLY